MRRPIPHPFAATHRVDRRWFLGTSLASAAGLALGACAGDDPAPAASGSIAASSTPASSIPAARATDTTTSAVPVTYDQSLPFYAQGNFLPVRDEIEALDLPVNGSLPTTLNGLYARNGSNATTGATDHWFVGDGMVHGVRLEAGRASWYRNRWVRTPLYDAGTGFAGSGQAPGGPVGQANVSVFTHGSRLLASGEIGWPYQLDADLDTVGAFDFGGVGPNVTAHPKVDPATELLHFFGYGITPPYLTYYVADADGALVHRAELPVGASTMIHDFAITDRDVVFWEFPVLFDLDAAIAGSALPFSWQPDYGSRLAVLPLGGTAAQTTWIEIDDAYVFHGTNAWRNGDRIEITVSRLPSVFAAGGDLDAHPSLLHRYTVDLGRDTPSVTTEQLHDLPLDLPTIDRRHTGRRSRRAFYVWSESRPEAGLEFLGLAGCDLTTGDVDLWASGPALQPNEPLFVADGDGEGEGWLLSFVWDRAADTSMLAVLDATDVGAGPVATVELPRRVPFGFHGTWLPVG